MLRPSLFLLLLFFCFNKPVFSQNQNLDYYISAGLQNSPLLKDYSNQVQLFILDSLKIRAGLKPLVGASAQAMYAPASGNSGYDSAITNGGNYTGLITVNQPLLRRNYRIGQYQSVALQRQTLITTIKISEAELRKNITSQYITAYADYSQLEFNRELLQLLRDEQTVLRTLVEKGIYLQTDYMNLSINVRAQEIAIKQAMMQYKVDLFSLNLLCGISDTSLVGLSKPDLQLQNRTDVSHSPQMLQYNLDSLRNANNKLLVDIIYKPKLDAFADAGFMSINPKNIPHNFGTGIGLNFSVPIYDGRLRKLEYSRIAIAEKTRLYYRDFYTSQFQLRVQQSTEQLNSTDELIAAISDQITAQQDLIHLYKAEMEKGLVRFSDFIIAVNNYANTRNTLKQAEISRQQIVNNLNYIK